jgi:hypothetical protein
MFPLCVSVLLHLWVSAQSASTWLGNEYNRPNIHGPCSLPNGAFLLASGQKVKDNTPVFISSGFSWPFGYLSGKAIQPAKQPDHDSSAIRWSPRSSCRHRDSSQWNHGEKVLIMSHATFWRSQSWLDPQHHKSTLNGYLAEFTGKPLDTVGNHYAKFTLFAVFLNAYQIKLNRWWKTLTATFSCQPLRQRIMAWLTR